MVNYYGALNYLALGDPEEAAVEARRLSRLLELGDDEEYEPAELAMREVLRYFAGSVFEASGNRNDAAVSYRHVWSPNQDFADNPLRPRFLDLYGEEWREEERPAPKQDFDSALDSIMASIAAGPPGDPAGDGSAADSVVAGAGPGAALDFAAPTDGIREPVAPDSLIAPPQEVAGRGGDVVVLLEHGFVAHRVERSVNVPLFPEEADALHSSDSNVRFAAASCVASRAFQDRYDFSEILSEGGTDWRGASGGKCIVSGAESSGNGSGDPGHSLYLMRVAWPEMVASGLPTDVSVVDLAIAADGEPLQLAGLDSVPAVPLGVPEDLDGGFVPTAEDGVEQAIGPRPTLVKPGMRGSVSDAVTEEFDDQLGGILVKAVARTALKYELARGLEKELDKENEILGEIAFLAANAAAAVFERADTRSWHLLPDEVSVVRLRLPVGVHPLLLQVETGRVGTRLIDLGEVEVRDGSVHVLAARVWP
jgi:hypothetical protein